jgi:hypothetical protein
MNAYGTWPSFSSCADTDDIDWGPQPHAKSGLVLPDVGRCELWKTTTPRMVFGFTPLRQL